MRKITLNALRYQNKMGLRNLMTDGGPILVICGHCQEDTLAVIMSPIEYEKMRAETESLRTQVRELAAGVRA